MAPFNNGGPMGQPMSMPPPMMGPAPGFYGTRVPNLPNDQHLNRMRQHGPPGYHFTSSDVRVELGLTNPHMQQPRQPYNNQGYMPNGATNIQPAPGATPLLPNQGRVLQTGPIRVLCIADVRGKR